MGRPTGYTSKLDKLILLLCENLIAYGKATVTVSLDTDKKVELEQFDFYGLLNHLHSKLGNDSIEKKKLYS